jgi:serine/threonine protein phosphatase PrpC
MHETARVRIAGADAAIEVSASTAIGRVRLVNEDSFVAEFPVFAVADGMGGHERGDLASQLAASVLRERLAGDAPTTSAAVLAAIEAANAAVFELSSTFGDDAMSGTTVAGIALVETDERRSVHWMAYNVGDSRIYTWNGRALVQLTVDHSAVQELVDAGLITEEAAREHPDRNVITRAMGAAAEVDADVWLLPITSAHTFLLCSDGLTKELDDDEIARILSSAEGPDAASEQLVEAASAAGGRDNITAVVVTLEQESAVAETSGTHTRSRLNDAVLEDTTPRA